jgi:predicted alpha/beta superfamily hydrolase
MNHDRKKMLHVGFVNVPENTIWWQDAKTVYQMIDALKENMTRMIAEGRHNQLLVCIDKTGWIFMISNRCEGDFTESEAGHADD